MNKEKDEKDSVEVEKNVHYVKVSADILLESIDEDEIRNHVAQAIVNTIKEVGQTSDYEILKLMKEMINGLCSTLAVSNHMRLHPQCDATRKIH